MEAENGLEFAEDVWGELCHWWDGEELVELCFDIGHDHGESSYENDISEVNGPHRWRWTNRVIDASESRRRLAGLNAVRAKPLNSY